MILAKPCFALEVGDTAPCVQLQQIQADDATATECVQAATAGTKYAMLEFFSTTCPACAENLPKVSQLAREAEATTTTRLVGIDRNASAIPQYVDQHRDLIDFPVSIDSSRQATRAYGVTATPTVFLVDSRNKIVYKTIGTFSDDDMNQIRQILTR